MLTDNDKLELARLYEEGDIFMLTRLKRILKPTADKIILDIEELITYNYVVVEMECGFFDWSQSLMDRYIKLKEKLFKKVGLEL